MRIEIWYLNLRSLAIVNWHRARKETTESQAHKVQKHYSKTKFRFGIIIRSMVVKIKHESLSPPRKYIVWELNEDGICQAMVF